MAVEKSKKNDKAPVGKRVTLKYTIKCDAPVTDGIFDIAAFEKYLQDRIKINGKTGVLGDQVTLDREPKVLNVQAVAPFSKRYLKYLTQKFLKKHQLRDYVRVIADTKTSYQLKYFSIENKEESK